MIFERMEEKITEERDAKEAALGEIEKINQRINPENSLTESRFFKDISNPSHCKYESKIQLIFN